MTGKTNWFAQSTIQTCVVSGLDMSKKSNFAIISDCWHINKVLKKVRLKDSKRGYCQIGV